MACNASPSPFGMRQSGLSWYDWNEYILAHRHMHAPSTQWKSSGQERLRDADQGLIFHGKLAKTAGRNNVIGRQISAVWIAIEEVPWLHGTVTMEPVQPLFSSSMR